ncbi:MAG: sodium-dependent bicarbonate transport family permease [Shimia sp.]|nr:sodium-dependent bicarbonate transport family permease [Shimia sp.]
MFIQTALGLAAAFGRSDLSIPKAVAKGMSIYLLSAIGFNGNATVTTRGIDGTLLEALAAGILTSIGLPFIVFALLKTVTGMSRPTIVRVAS